jgi:hypothetical protein
MTSGYYSDANKPFTTQMLTPESLNGIVADQIVNTAGSYAASASLTENSPWLMQLVAFRGVS